ncbi:MAG: hypothetical protein ACREQ5_15770 [Candidatus Dormibacteria bacterium]
MIITREKILVAIPAYDSRMEISCVSGLMQCIPYYERPFFWCGMSNIALARNEIAHIFVEQFTQYDWIMMIDSDTGFTTDDWNLLWEGDEEIVCAEYSRKMLGEPPVQFGLGFTRVHRNVFERIKKLMHEDGSERVNRFYHKGKMMVDYFPNGAIQSGRWIGEDQGFFMWAALTEATLRIETRTHLNHVGRFEFGYPDQVKGYVIKGSDEDGAQ